MKIQGSCYAFCVSVGALLAACGGLQSPISPSSAMLPSTVYTQTSRAHSAGRPNAHVHFVYVANFSTESSPGSVSAYAINARSGALKQVQGSPFGAGTNPQGVAIDPTGQFAYVVNYRSNDVSAYAINPRSGALKPVRGSPFAAGSNPFGVAIDPRGKFAYVTNRGGYGMSSNVSAYAIDASSGALKHVKGSPFAAGSHPQGVAIDPTGKFAYVANEGSNTVSAYAIDASSGALTDVQGSPFATGSFPFRVAIDPKGKFAYVTNWGGASGAPGSVSAFTINAKSGALTEVTGSPFAAGMYPEGVAIDPTGRFAYVVNLGGGPESSPGSVSAYAIKKSSGALTPVPGSPFISAEADPTNVAIDPTGKFAYVANTGTANVSAYVINASTGALTQVKGSPFNAGIEPGGVAVR